MDPNPSADLLGWAIGQRSGYDWVEYNAKTGTLLRKVGAGTTDLARGVCGDVDPGQKGYECWTGGSVYNMLNLTGSPIGSGAPAQNFRIFWDGDVLAEVLDSNTVSKWAYPGAPSGGFTSANLAGLVPTRNAAPLYGDMFGDWREEVLFEQSGSASIRIYSTAIPTDKRIYTLMHDPEYRNSMNEKGYQQSHMLDYYLGDGMADPPKPNIKYPDGSGAAGAGGTTGAGNTGGSSETTGATGAGGNPETGGNTVVETGGAVVTAGTTAVAPATGGNTSTGAGGAVAGQSGTAAQHSAAASGCSCAIGAVSDRTSAGYLVAMLGLLGLVLNRRRRRRD
jgi:MYXO-CTERM domain-containing protein